MKWQGLRTALPLNVSINPIIPQTRDRPLSKIEMPTPKPMYILSDLYICLYTFSLPYYRYSQPLGWTLPAGRRRHDGKHLQSAVVSKKKQWHLHILFFQPLPWIQKVQTLSFLTHRDTGGAFASNLNDCVSSRAVHPWERAVQHADGRRRWQQVHTLNHRPFGPAERLRHGFETHLTAERNRE